MLSSARSSRSAADGPRPSGAPLVVGLLGLGAALAAFALVFQWRQTDGCLGFYGGRVARAISVAPCVEIWRLAAGDHPGQLVAMSRCDVSRAPGLVHLRRGLVEDANFDWRPPGPGRLPSDEWDAAIAFRQEPGGQPTAILALRFAPEGGALSVVGRPGRVGLGRLAGGLRDWVRENCPGVEVGPGGVP